MRIISIQGNIGSGKSTFVNYLKNNISNKKILFLEEPVEEWENIKNASGKNVIEEFYSDKTKYAFGFQVMACLSLMKQIKSAMDIGNYEVIICERSIFTNKNVFAKMLYDEGNINEIEYQIYENLFNTLIDNYKSYKEEHIYIKTEPNIAIERIKKRNRSGEENISLDYLIKCNDYHENWLTGDRVLTFDGNVDIDSENELHYTWCNKILEYFNI